MSTMFHPLRAEALFVSELIIFSLNVCFRNCFGFRTFRQIAQASVIGDRTILCFSLLAAVLSSPKLSLNEAAGGGSMALRDALSLYGRIGLIVAAFTFVAGIVAGPILERILFSPVSVTERSIQPALPPSDTPSERQAGKPG